MKSKYYLILTTLIIATSCNREPIIKDNGNCLPSFFEHQTNLYNFDKEKNDSFPVFILHRSYKFQNRCGYFYTLHSFGRHILVNGVVNAEFNESSGFIYSENMKQVYLVPIDKYYSPYPIKLFDFNIIQHDSFSFKVQNLYTEKHIIPLWNKYTCILDSIYISNPDSIYKFRYVGLCNFDQDDQLVVFASKDNGIIGAYISYFPFGASERILYTVGRITQYPTAEN